MNEKMKKNNNQKGEVMRKEERTECCNSETKPLSIPLYMNNIDRNVEVLFDVICAIGNRLTPILRQEPETAVRENDCEKDLPELPAKLLEIDCAIKNCSQMIYSLIDRLEL